MQTVETPNFEQMVKKLNSILYVLLLGGVAMTPFGPSSNFFFLEILKDNFFSN